MGRKIKERFILTIFALVLMIVGFFAGQYYLSRIYEQQVEVGYRRALSEFATHLQELSTEVGRSRLALSDHQRQSINSNIRRVVYATQINMGELPLGEIQLERIAHLLNRVYEQTYDLAEVSNTSALEIDQLYGQIRYISHELQHLLVRKEGQYPWVSWHEYVTTSAVFPGMLQGLALINDGLEDFRTPRRSGEITGEEIGREKAIEVAQAFCGAELVFQVNNEGQGTIPTYTLEAKEGTERIILEVSKRGGVVLWMIATKEVSETRLGLEELVQLGETFLTERGFPPVHLTDVQSLEHRLTLTFVPIRGGVLYYGEPVKVQISAMDGSVLGFWGTPFYLAESRVKPEQETQTLEVIWSPDEKVRPGVEILAQKLAFIPNEQEEEVLVQRLGVQYQGEYYLIYLNAQTGEEERIERVSSPQFF